MSIFEVKFNIPFLPNWIPESFGWMEGNHSNEAYIRYQFFLTHYENRKKRSIHCIFGIYKEDEGPALVDFFTTQGLDFKGRINKLKYFKDEISGLNNCVEFTNTEQKRKEEFNIKSVIWSKSKGLVSYEIESADGEIKCYRRKL